MILNYYKYYQEASGKYCTYNNFSIFELFWKNSSYVSGVSVCIFVALYLCMFGCLLQEPIRLKVLWVDP